ncbi:MAG: hypothetical protein AB7V43_19580, partial [Acidimicrobiia bacterium]
MAVTAALDLREAPDLLEIDVGRAKGHLRRAIPFLVVLAVFAILARVVPEFRDSSPARPAIAPSPEQPATSHAIDATINSDASVA